MKNNLHAIYRLTRLNEHFGNSVAATALGTLINPSINKPILFVQLLLINILLGIFSFAINDIEDADDDAKDAKKAKRNPISARDLSLLQAWLVTWGSAALALVLAWLLGKTILVLTTVTIILGFLYSYKGFRLKSMPIVDIVSHGLFLGTLPFLVAALAGQGTMSFITGLFGTLIFLVSAMGDIDNEIRDYDVDRLQHIRNTASLIDLRPLAPFVHILHSLLAVSILVVILGSLSSTGLIILAIVGVVIAGRYLTIKVQERNHFYYKYSQLLLASVGILLLIDRWLPNLF